MHVEAGGLRSNDQMYFPLSMYATFLRPKGLVDTAITYRAASPCQGKARCRVRPSGLFLGGGRAQGRLLALAIVVGACPTVGCAGLRTGALLAPPAAFVVLAWAPQQRL